MEYDGVVTNLSFHPVFGCAHKLTGWIEILSAAKARERNPIRLQTLRTLGHGMGRIPVLPQKLTFSRFSLL